MSARIAQDSVRTLEKPPVPERGAYLGAILLDGQTSMEQFNRDTGIRHAMFMTFLSFPEVLDPHGPEHARAARFVRECRGVAALPAITLECFGGLNSYSRSHIEAFADWLNRCGTPMILRWNHEMNGSWYPWGQQPDLYVRRFREFAGVIRQRAPRVAMAWTPNQGWGYPWPMCKFFNPNLASPDGLPLTPTPPTTRVMTTRTGWA